MRYTSICLATFEEIKGQTDSPFEQKRIIEAARSIHHRIEADSNGFPLFDSPSWSRPTWRAVAGVFRLKSGPCRVVLIFEKFPTECRGVYWLAEDAEAD